MARRKNIELSDRPWASRKLFQRFLGPYVEDAHTGLFFSTDSSQENRELVTATVPLLHPAVRKLCREYELTFSFSSGVTVVGNASTFYADFSQRDRRLISPHIEMGKYSLTEDVVHPHLAHETAHLWWRNLPESTREAYREWLTRRTTGDTIEVTAYAQNLLNEWRLAVRRPDSDLHVDYQRFNALKSWSEESFCETVAVLQAPSYPSLQQRCNVDLQVRRS